MSNSISPATVRFRVSRWPISVRAKFGEYANWFEVSKGLSWQDAEFQAYAKVQAILDDHRRKTGKSIVLEIPRESLAVRFGPDDGFLPNVEDTQFVRDWNRQAAALFDRQQAAANEKAKKEEEKQQARLAEKNTGPYEGEREKVKKKGGSRRRKADPNTKTMEWEPAA